MLLFKFCFNILPPHDSLCEAVVAIPVGVGAPTPLFARLGGPNATFNEIAGLGGG